MLLDVQGVGLKLGKYSQLKFGLVLGTGALIALVLYVQCVRTYIYAGTVLVPQQAEREAERQVGALSAAARSDGITKPSALGPTMERTLEPGSDRVLWMRVLDPNSDVVAQGGSLEGAPRFPARWRDRIEKHESLATIVNTRKGKALVVMLPLRMPRPPRHSPQLYSPESRSGPPDDRRAPYLLEVAVSLKAVAASFAGLRYNLVLGLIASIALLVSLVVIGLRAPHYLRGKYLESELQLAKRVQSDLQPKPQSVSPHVEFACERINRMLCERTAGERFATLFWGVFDPANNKLCYVNAGHLAPMLVRQGGQRIERLSEGGPVLGLLPHAHYSAGCVDINDGDKLIAYSDGIVEAFSEHEEEFGEARIAETMARGSDDEPEKLCEQIVKQVTAFASTETPQDDRTLIIVKFAQSATVVSDRKSPEIGIAAVV